MAFNFNWSPLIADTSRAKDMLTAALNKSPKPPIIVDDIIVTELNLGSTPPELEILEIGDLAEDRFRGIFKMSYTGDAFLTLKTRVQANPLNTYLSAKPSFASPQPLAAASSLTIPLSITLSDFRLSGFVILVFSRQKGLTLVFRNDPLESLKVSSTFDSIPFVRDYLQKEIEGQLRVLFMEDLPAILHRLSLRLWSPDHQEVETFEKEHNNSRPVDPLASPPQDPFDNTGNAIDEGDLGGWSLDNTETHASFSAKNILRLAALAESQKTLSLFTPSIQDAVFRAWAGAAERAEHSGLHTPLLTRSALSRVQSSMSTTSLAASISEGSESGAMSSRPSISGSGSLHNGLRLGGGRSRTQARKRKNRVINLRRNKDESTTTTTTSPSSIAPDATPRAPAIPSPPIDNNPEDFTLPLRSAAPNKGVRFNPSSSPVPTTPSVFDNQGPVPPPLQPSHMPATARPSTPPPLHIHHPQPTTPSKPPLLRSTSADRFAWQPAYTMPPSSLAEASASMGSGGILEQAWMMKMAREIAIKVAEERERGSVSGKGVERRSEEGEAPPAYVA